MYFSSMNKFIFPKLSGAAIIYTIFDLFKTLFVISLNSKNLGKGFNYFLIYLTFNLNLSCFTSKNSLFFFCG